MTISRMKSIAIVTPMALATALTGCSDSNPIVPPPPVTLPGPTPAPPPTPAPTPTGFNVQPCFDQVIPGTGGTTVAGAVVPDTLTLSLNAPSG